MKMRKMILLAMSAVLGVFSTGNVLAAYTATSAQKANFAESFRIERIDVSLANDGARQPLKANTTVYFDVVLTNILDVGTNSSDLLRISGNDISVDELDGARPHLVLNIPLKGTSTKLKVDTVDGEEAEVTDTAVAFYVGKCTEVDNNVLRFAYDVRPGDLCEVLSWAKKTSGTLTGAPRFGGNLDAIAMSVKFPNVAQSINLPLAETVLCAKGTDPGALEEPAAYAVNGYTMTIGDLDGTGDMNKGVLYQGLVPVTVSTVNNAPAAYFDPNVNDLLASECYFWVEALDTNVTPAEWKYAPVAVTHVKNAETKIREADYANTALTEKTALPSGAVKFAGLTTSAAFASQTFFVNIPASIDAGTAMRLCYGVRNDGKAESNILYGYLETTLRETPLTEGDNETLNISGYSVHCGDMDQSLAIPLPGKTELTTAAEGLAGKSVSGGILKAAAGDTFELVVLKNNINQLSSYGTLYAAVDCISATDKAQAKFDSYTIPLNPDNAEGFVLNLTIGAFATEGETYYRVRIPQIDTLTGETIDKPFYLKIESSPKRETIMLTPSAAGATGTEYYTPAEADTTTPGKISFLEYTLSVPASTAQRRFKIFPVFDDRETQITQDMVFDGSGIKVHEVLRRYVSLQLQPGSIVATAKDKPLELVVIVPANATSATFYVGCINDYPLQHLSDTVTVGGVAYSVGQPTFIAKTCASNGKITGTNDECLTYVQPTVLNRAPTINSASTPAGGSVDTKLNFNFGVRDTSGDYLIATMDYGDGTVETILYADDDEMIALMGDDEWSAILQDMANTYGGDPADYSIDDEGVCGRYRGKRSDLNGKQITFTHAYATATSPTWRFTVTDSSGDNDYREGQLNLTAAQRFTFYTISNATRPGSGYIRWAATQQDMTPGSAGFDWSFGTSFTYNALAKDGGNSSVLVQAVPFAAGAETPAGYTPVSAEKDSFFYKWAARHADYEPLLPTGTGLYENEHAINRAFVSGGGEADDPKKWQDIVLAAIFTAEYHPFDAIGTDALGTPNAPYIHDLGDYNNDGIPDGWLLSNLGIDAAVPLIEGGDIAATAPAEDTIPEAGWANGEGAYRWQPAGTRLGYHTDGPGPYAPGIAFDYMTRLRGLDGLLNAADGNGNWLSVIDRQIWVHTEWQDNNNNILPSVDTGTEDDPTRMVIRLYDGVTPRANTAWTESGVPYDDDEVAIAQNDGWAYVIDADGNPINATGAYIATIVQVQTNEESELYDTVRYSAEDGNWGHRDEENNWVPGDGTFEARYIPVMTAFDDPFRGADPRAFSWLDRFPPNSADVDGDGISNGMEYYFWYFASRMAWAPTVTVDGTEEILEDAWPLVDLRKIDNPNTSPVMGRKYRNAYNPDDADAAEDGNGNLWEPLSALEVLNAFNPYVAGARNRDTDNDGLSDIAEVQAGTNPIDFDTDGDGIPDGWEVTFGTNPLVADSGENPDDDYFAFAVVTEYPDYQLLYPVNKIIRREYDDAGNYSEEPQTYVGDETDVPGYYYYNAVTKQFCVIEGTATFDRDDKGTLTVTNRAPKDPASITFADITYPEGDSLMDEIEDVDILEDSKNEEKASIELTFDDPIWVAMEPVEKTLRDHDVYKAFGFSCQRAWTSNPPDDYTQPFSNLEEFKSAVVRADGGDMEAVIEVSTNPNKADTNDDGMPDGWSLYVGFNPLDNRVANEDADEDGLNNAAEYAMGVNGWGAKAAPTDPHNPDSDFDSVPDAAERAYLATGGMNPNSADTDGDGMPDGWEYLYGSATLADVEDVAGAPDPTNNHDADLDWDRDGLTNYQECFVGLLRHLRYDLGPDAARLYKDQLGKIYDTSDDQAKYAWEVLPDVYSAMDDLSTPTLIDSMDYQVKVPILEQAWASRGGTRDQAYAAAFNRIWNSTIIFPTQEQTGGYGLLAAAVDKDMDKTEGAVEAVNTQIETLQKTIIAFDAAYHRFLAAAGNQVKINLADRQIRALMTRIDTILVALEAEAVKEVEAGTTPDLTLRKALATFLKPKPATAFLKPVGTSEMSESRMIWEKRKRQVANQIAQANRTVGAEQVPMAIDPLFDGDDILTDNNLTHTYKNFTEVPADAGATDYVNYVEPYVATDYEEAVYTTESPLLRATYRSAVRGFNGGLRNGLIAPIAQHAPIKPFATAWNRKTGVLTFSDERDYNLGRSISADALKAQHTTAFATTDPRVADSDADGMDDYWEIFHGLNPILGDTVYDESVAGSGYGAYSSDLIRDAYATYELEATGKENYIFNPPELDKKGNVTGYDYYTYPWLAGAPYADPDGDGLLNFEEAVNPVGSDPAHYGTDPSPLWMTDKDNPNSFTSRFYGLTNCALQTSYTNLSTVTMADVAGILPGATAAPVYVKDVMHNLKPELPGKFVLPFEINEGYDTDGDGVGDLTELTSTTVNRGDPQTLRTPDRQQAAYFGGAGALQSFAETQFGPTALTTFTLECWVKPEAVADQVDITDDNNEVILIDRPWRFTDDSELTDADVGNVRHNFILGLRAEGTVYKPFVNYTGAGTTYEEGSQTVPQVSPTVVSGETIAAGEWNHIAATYDGSRLAIIINGVETGAESCALIPANGVISIKNDGLDDYRRFTYREAPIMIGATAGSRWIAKPGNPNAEQPFKTTGNSIIPGYFAKCYTGFIDEVRIWNGARTASQIAEANRIGFTQAQLLDFRYKAFMARYEGNGYYQANTPAEPLAIYTFNDLLSSTKADLTKPWETYPGQQLVGEKPGSFTYRRQMFNGLLDGTQASSNGYIAPETHPTADELFTSYYTLTVPKHLRSTKYYETEEVVTNNEGEVTATKYYTEYVPLAHNTVAHLPVPDVERDIDEENLVECLLKSDKQDEGSPKLRFPSGSPQNLKVTDSVYWSPYAAGYKASPSKIYSVKTAGNPYAYYYGATYTFDVLNYRVYPAYTYRYGTDLFVYGDVYAKYDTESWDNSPSTDPSAGSTATKEPAGEEWFEYPTQTDASGVETDVASGTDFDDIQYSVGGSWLENNVALGQTKDTDSDRMPNWWENYYGLDPEDPTGVNGPHGDADGDYLTNYAEFLAKANPGKYSTVGNGVPDSQIPIWFRRGRPTFALLYTDNDMMEDHWEAANRSDRLSVDFNDASGDADNDGWSNFAEARAGFRSSRHSTDPNASNSFSQTGASVMEKPTPAIRLTVDYFGDQNVYTNATDAAKIVVHAYTAKNNNSAPDAVFKLPLATATTAEEAREYTQDIGNWYRGVVSGYLHLGNIVPGSMRIRFARQMTEGSEEVDENDFLYFDIVADTADGNEAALYYNQEVTVTEELEDGTEATTTEIVRVPAGKVNYTTGYYELDFTDVNDWPSFWKYTSEAGVTSYYDATENTGTVTYRSAVVAGMSNTFTLVKPDAGYLREGKNNFFVFADLNGNGSWQDGEPAGIPDQHDVEIGFDLVNKPLHVALTEAAPPGAVRLDVKSILDQVMTQRVVEDADDAEGYATASLTADSSDSSDSGEALSSVINPSTGDYLKISDFPSKNTDYDLALVSHTAISIGNVETSTGSAVVYQKRYNTKKPYLTEDEIFGYTSTGLPGTSAVGARAMTYKVYYVPTTLSNSGINTWTDYNIAIVTNKLEMLDDASTALVRPLGGDIYHNTELAFEWLCNVQVPTFTLTITKTADGSGETLDTGIVVYQKTVRGVTPIASAIGTGLVEQFRYRYMLPRGIGELNDEGTSVFGNGTYVYTLALNPYNGSSKVLSGKFSLQLTDSGDANLIEKADAEQDTSANAQDSFYVRTRVRYNGVLSENSHFGGRRIKIEAHYSGSFNGDPIASTSDKLIYDKQITGADGKPAYDDAAVANSTKNRCVRMVKDKIHGDNGDEDYDFFSTRFDAEIRGLATDKPVYLMAYFDLNGNNKRDSWEPWGYATQGLDSPSGFYYDPRAVKPINNGKDYQVEFYIQDVDTDNDKLADCWEWLAAGKPTTPFADWCSKLGAALSSHRGTSIWVPNAKNGGASLTAYGAQLYGLTVIGEADANGAVQVEDFPEDVQLALELMAILGQDTALALFNDGYLSYGLSIASITCDGDSVTLAWEPTATGVADGAGYDISAVFANASTTAVYAIYGKASIADTEWTKLSEVQVSGATAPSLTIPLADTTIEVDGEVKPAAFFKVILSAKTAEATLAD